MKLVSQLHSYHCVLSWYVLSLSCVSVVRIVRIGRGSEHRDEAMAHQRYCEMITNCYPFQLCPSGCEECLAFSSHSSTDLVIDRRGASTVINERFFGLSSLQWIFSHLGWVLRFTDSLLIASYRCLLIMMRCILVIIQWSKHR